MGACGESPADYLSGVKLRILFGGSLRILEIQRLLRVDQLVERVLFWRCTVL